LQRPSPRLELDALAKKGGEMSMMGSFLRIENEKREWCERGRRTDFLFLLHILLSTAPAFIALSMDFASIL
jgi:hypothetical protein